MAGMDLPPEPSRAGGSAIDPDLSSERMRMARKITNLTEISGMEGEGSP
jgi:hypothetical protein